ncbi:hypothetical protein OIU84_028227 [Salix udensis]|uniref:Uncharacterized protein n=1 Tax=Salix udensis TaxID=889485 RepID=A0AAD6KCB0_9ROSI|nr:hypothetical protein OIU84_028227 [Salix udensis]
MLSNPSSMLRLSRLAFLSHAWYLFCAGERRPCISQIVSLFRVFLFN